MNLILKRFSQDVDLSNPEKIQYFFVFSLEDGKEIRLPVQKETTEELLKVLYGNHYEETKEAQEDTSEEEENYDLDNVSEENADQQVLLEQTEEGTAEEDIPDSEDAIPSL